MKIFLIAYMLLLVSCTKSRETVVDLPSVDTIPSEPIPQETDTITRIEVILNDSVKLKYPKVAYDGFARWFKTMQSKKIMPPDAALQNFVALDDYNDIQIYFTSEVGQDDFYMLYAYFLQQVNGVEKYSKERHALFSAFRILNKLRWYYEYGGTYFGHMHDRIYGYAEFSITTIDKDLSNNTNIDKEKNTFLSDLKKVYIQNLKEDGNTLLKDKPKREKEMVKMIDEMGAYITNAYQLKEVKQFYADHYGYWM